MLPGMFTPFDLTVTLTIAIAPRVEPGNRLDAE